jgi:hypothetical protein
LQGAVGKPLDLRVANREVEPFAKVVLVYHPGMDPDAL